MPHRFPEARARGDVSPGAFEVGCWLTCRAAYRTHRLAVTITELLIQLGRPATGRDTLVRQLRELRSSGWITFHVSQGQRGPWDIALAGLRPLTDRHDFRTVEPARADLTSASPQSREAGSLHGETVSAASKLPHDLGSKKEKIEPPKPPAGGPVDLTWKRRRRYTGCRAVRGSHGTRYVRSALGTDQPPPDWPYRRPRASEITLALKASQKPSLQAEPASVRVLETCMECGEKGPCQDDGERIRCIDLEACRRRQEAA
jgi:hypothetical protein